MSRVSTENPGSRVLMLGNEAVVRGALESGVQFASNFPGTPASEIGDTFSKVADEHGICFEYSTNEKVAFEAAAGASFSGLRSMVSFKHFGLNVALDSIPPVAYVGVEGGLVVAFADDPNGWSSAQSEQDSRCFAKIANMPMIEPSSSQECIDFTKAAFDISEKYRIPVFLRLTTRVSHTTGLVSLGKLVRGDRKARFVRDLAKYDNFPPKIVRMHADIAAKIERIRKEVSEKDFLNKIINEGKSDVGIITSGVSYNYVLDAMDELGTELPVLKLGTLNPMPEEMIAKFLKDLKSVMVVEELEPFIETHVKAIAKDSNPGIVIAGKGKATGFPIEGEYTPEMVLRAVANLLGKDAGFDYDKHMEEFSNIRIPRRFPVLCPGCPHRATFYAVKKAAGEDVVIGGDIGCYMLGVFPPFKTLDFLLAMGAGLGVTHGISRATESTESPQKAIAYIGDSTFFHAGIPALINMVFNNSNVLVIVLDNRITAMTGHQPNPGTGLPGKSEPIKIDEIALACGVKNVKVVDPFNINSMMETVKDFLGKDGVSVIVAKRPCQLLEYKAKKRKGPVAKFEVEGELDKSEEKELKDYGCPAYYEKDGKLAIDEKMCWGCASCLQLAKGKIKPKGEDK